jgi:ADP-ribosylglycohydrolase
MTLFTAEGLVLAADAGTLPERSAVVRNVHRAYLRWLRTQRERSRHPTFERTSEGWLLGLEALHARRAPDATCLSALSSDRMGRVEHPLNSSKGSGATARIAPVGLALAVDDPFGLGCDIAALTHGHPTAYLSAGFLALVIRELLCGATLIAACREGLGELRRHPDHQGCSGAIERALALSEGRGSGPLAGAALGNCGDAERVLARALHCALAAPNLESALRLTSSLGGERNIIGALAGGLLGATHGDAAIPAGWLGNLELRVVIERTADELCTSLCPKREGRHT